MTDMAEESIKSEMVKSSVSKETFQRLIDEHDWFYMMSDDSRTFNAGSVSEGHLRKIIKQQPELEELFKKKEEEMFHPNK